MANRIKPPVNPQVRYRIGDYLSTKDAAVYLGISLRTLHYHKSHGEIPFHKHEVTGRVRFRFLDVERLRVKRAEAWQRQEAANADRLRLRHATTPEGD